MNVGVFALKALEWIGRVIGIVQTPAGKNFLETILGKALGDRAPKYMKKLAKLEATIGAHTRCWSKVEAASKAGVEVTLTIEEAEYLFTFKKLWDRYIKKPLDQTAIKLESPEPSPETLVTIDLVNEAIDDADDDPE